MYIIDYYYYYLIRTAFNSISVLTDVTTPAVGLLGNPPILPPPAGPGRQVDIIIMIGWLLLLYPVDFGAKIKCILYFT